MKIKEVHVGKQYALTSYKKSRPGCSLKYFEELIGEPVVVTKKLHNFNNSNTIQVQGVCTNAEGYELVSFWCSPYDLDFIKDTKDTKDTT